MEYTINKLGKLAGISTRTLRYYDEIGLLHPCRVNSNGYRIYGQAEVDLLQQILFYRELGFALEDIKSIISSPNYDSLLALSEHLAALRDKRGQLDLLIANVEKTIKFKQGELEMSNEEKFEGFKQRLIEDNEKQYGEEIHAKYGDDAVNRSNAKMKGMTKQQYERIEALNKEISLSLKAAISDGNPEGELAAQLFRLHREWLCIYSDSYCKEYHCGLAQMYVEDARFKKYYDDIADGGAQFLSDAIMHFCQ